GEGRRRHVAIAREPAVPAGHVRPRLRSCDGDQLIDTVRVRGEWLPLDLRHVARRPEVDSPSADLRGAMPEGNVRLFDARLERGGHVYDVARAAGESPRGDPPAVLEVARHDGLERLHRMAVVEQGARSDPADR